MLKLEWRNKLGKDFESLFITFYCGGGLQFIVMFYLMQVIKRTPWNSLKYQFSGRSKSRKNTRNHAKILVISKPVPINICNLEF